MQPMYDLARVQGNISCLLLQNPIKIQLELSIYKFIKLSVFELLQLIT